MFKIITIPFDKTLKGFDDEILNMFIINKNIISSKAEFFSDGNDKYWVLLIEYEPVLEPAKPVVEIQLDKAQKILYENLRKWRKEKADKEGVPVFIIGSNKELAEITKNAPKSLEALNLVKGFGKGKITKYGKEIIDIVNAFYGEK